MRAGSLLILGAWIIFSCQEIKECTLESSTDFAIIRFYEADTTVRTIKSVAFSRIYEESVTQFVISTVLDTIDDDTLVAIGLPLNPMVKEVNYVFETDTLIYTLKLAYLPHLRIYYEDCDPVYSYRLDTLITEGFDSVVITNPVLDRDVISNVEVYL